MDKLVSIGKAAKILGVSEITLRRWDEAGKLTSVRTEGGHRRYDISKIKPELVHRFDSQDTRKTIAYSRVSTNEQKDDLERQQQALELFCSKNGWSFETISDIGSGVDYYKKGLTKLLNAILDDRVGRLVLAQKDRLLRFGAELVFSVCEAKGVEVVIINQGVCAPFEEEDLAADILEIAAVFSARLYGAQNERSKNIMENLEKSVTEQVKEQEKDQIKAQKEDEEDVAQ